MIYFKKVDLSHYSYDQIEHGLRKVSLKRTLSLDLVSPVSDIGSDKYFLGREKGNSLTFTRIRTSLEKMLPKAIIKLTRGNSNYEVRLSLISTIIGVFLALLFLLSLIVGLVINNNAKGISATAIVMIIYVLLIALELKLLRLNVTKALNGVVQNVNSI